jgi:hypothetical protein
MLTLRGPVHAVEIKLRFIYSEANWTLLKNIPGKHVKTQCLEGNCSNREVHIAVKQIDVPLYIPQYSKA